MRNILPSLVFLALFACQTNNDPVKQVVQQQQSQVNLKENRTEEAGKINAPEKEFFALNGKDQLILTHKSTRIKIPANALEHQDGSKPSKKARLIFSEYHTSGEILASGLPMKYTDASGKTIDFESAGMFEIRAEDNGKPLRIKKGKNIEVELASEKDGAYNFYQLNDNTRAWKEEQTNLKPLRNEYLKQVSDSINAVELAEPPKKFVKAQPTDVLIDLQLNAEQYEDVAELGPVLWKVMKPLPEKQKNWFKEKYEFVSIATTPDEELVFEMKFSTKTDTITTLLAPVYPEKLKSRGEKNFQKRMAEFREKVRVKEELRKQQRNEAAFIRKMKLDQFGVYNFDRQLKGYNIPILASFTFGDVPHEQAPSMVVYLVPKGKSALIKYDIHSAQWFAYNPSEANVLFAVNSENEVFALSDEEIRGLHLAQKKGQQVTIRLKKRSDKASTAQEVDQLVASL